eukprot:9513251-Karenia_brevis.AAC.1
MKPDVLMKLTKSGRLSLRPTPESQLLKLRKQKLRASRKSEVDTKASHLALAHRRPKCESQAILAQIPALDIDFKTIADE